MSADDRSGVLVIRLWLEDGFEERPLRARITRTVDAAAARSLETVVSSEEEILAVVESWLRGFAAHP